MEGIREAIAFITDLAVKAEKPETIVINGRTYCTKSLKRYDEADKAEPIRATTLTSLVDYIKESREELRDRMIIQVVSATKVLLYSGLLPERDRETLFEVNALLPHFEYGREYDQESFLVSMQGGRHEGGEQYREHAGGHILGRRDQPASCDENRRHEERKRHYPQPGETDPLPHIFGSGAAGKRVCFPYHRRQRRRSCL